MSHAPGIVVKVGGSLLSDPPRLRAVLARLAEGGDGPAAIVPGGGAFADAVRAVQSALGLGEPLAHRLALDAMGRMAEVFAGLEPRLRIARSPADVRAALAKRRAVIWDPVALRDGHPDIAENWDVTSDSLALWLAIRLDVQRCVLLKSAPCPAASDLETLARLGFVDRAFPTFALAFAGEIIARGPHGEAKLSRADTSASPPPPPEARGEAEPRGELPEGSVRTGGLRGLPARAPRDEGERGIAVCNGSPS